MMAAIHFECPKCKSNLEYGVSAAGKKVRCPECGERVGVPGKQKWLWVALATIGGVAVGASGGVTLTKALTQSPATTQKITPTQISPAPTPVAVRHRPDSLTLNAFLAQLPSKPVLVEGDYRLAHVFPDDLNPPRRSGNFRQNAYNMSYLQPFTHYSVWLGGRGFGYVEKKTDAGKMIFDALKDGEVHHMYFLMRYTVVLGGERAIIVSGVVKD